MVLAIWIAVAILFCVLAYAFHNRKKYHLLSHYHQYSPFVKREMEQSGYLVHIGRFTWGIAILWILTIPFLAFKVTYAMEVSLTVFLLYVMVGTWIIRRFDVAKKRKRNTRILLMLYMAIAIILGFIFIQGQQETKVKINEQSIVFDSMYTYRLPIKDIESVEWMEQMPENLIKLNGYATTWRSLGYFQSKELGKGVHFVYPNKPPFIYIRAKHTYILINSRDKQETEQWYDRIHAALQGAGME
ncbi:DUF3784 domain-containing protein [Bacillus testis]|uniref:DUF3784 domain-containing protein n=1 Tax=Bacillus testis TaxID=1622072 RepID=UPI00067EC305|nr:DUF3784 domain-containing protein [Bacillus testis]